MNIPTRTVLLGLLLAIGGCTHPVRWGEDRIPTTPLHQDQDPERRAQEAEEAARIDAVMEELVAPPVASSADTGELVLSVEDAVLLAMQHNPDLRLRRYDPVIAATFADIERGAWDPELFAGISVDRERTSETDRGTGERFSVDSESGRAVLGVRQDLPSGTSLALQASQTRDTSDRTPDQEETRIGLSVTQALLRGSGPAVTLAEVRQAVLDSAISRYELRGYAEALAAETETAYWDLLLAERRIAILEDSLAVAERERDDTAARIEIGTAPQSAAAATRSEVARRQQHLIDARAARASQALRLLRLITPPGTAALDRPLRLTSPAAVEPSDTGKLTDHLALALVKRPDLAEARLRLDQRRLATVVTRNGLLPRLDFFAELGKTGYGEDSSEAIDNLDGDTFDLTVGVDFSYRLGQRAAAARHRGAVAERQQARAAIANLEQLIDLELRLAWIECDRARQQIVASRTTVRLQEETLQAERDRLAVGASTPLLVAQAQRDLLQAQLQELAARIAWRQAVIDLYRSDGSLLERRGIRLGDEQNDRDDR